MSSERVLRPKEPIKYYPKVTLEATSANPGRRNRRVVTVDSKVSRASRDNENRRTIPRTSHVPNVKSLLKQHNFQQESGKFLSLVITEPRIYLSIFHF